MKRGVQAVYGPPWPLAGCAVQEPVDFLFHNTLRKELGCQWLIAT
jgi:hypothetical protein